jgi:hypothetical protein
LYSGITLYTKEPEDSYSGSSLATGRVFHNGQVKGDDPDENGYPGPPRSGLGVRLKASPLKDFMSRKPQKISRKGLTEEDLTARKRIALQILGIRAPRR